jgi:glycosyltransferase involved in cell wall biosynthesis
LRILFCHNRYAIRSGEDIAFETACELLTRAGHDLITVVRDSRSIGEISLGRRLHLGASVVHSASAAREVSRVAIRDSPAVALVQNVFPLLSPSIYRALARAGVPIVQLVFNYRFLCLNGQFFTAGAVCERCRGGNYLHGVVRRCFRGGYAESAAYATALGIHRALGTWQRSVRRFVVPDRFLGEKLVHGGFPADRIRTVCNPFDVERYVPNYGGEGYALFVGRWIRPKGIFTLLDAAARTKVKVVIAGDGEDAEGVRAHPVVRAGTVTLVGAVYGEEMERLLNRAGMVVVPSEWYDNLPMMVCQAFAAGKPVVASRINGIPEYVRDGETGLLFAPGDAAGLATSLDRLAADEGFRLSLGREARRTAEQLFSPGQWVAAMELVMEEAMGG